MGRGVGGNFEACVIVRNSDRYGAHWLYLSAYDWLRRLTNSRPPGSTVPGEKVAIQHITCTCG